MGITRGLKEIGQVMDSMVTQKDLGLFLEKTENAQKLNGLVQDIRYTLMDYQVGSPKGPVFVITNMYLDFVATRHLQRGLPADREPYSLTVLPYVVTCE